MRTYFIAFSAKQVCYGARDKASSAQVRGQTLQPGAEGAVRYSTECDARDSDSQRTLSGYVDQRTGALLAQEQLKSFLVYGGEKVVFEKEEIAEIKKLQPPGMYSLLGRDV